MPRTKKYMSAAQAKRLDAGRRQAKRAYNQRYSEANAGRRRERRHWAHFKALIIWGLLLLVGAAAIYLMVLLAGR